MAFDVWLGFFAACWVISLSPGAGAIASMSSGLQFGFRRGYWNVIGLQLALALQILIVAAGVGAVLATSALAFNLIKWFGVAYLLYLAYKQWQQPPSVVSAEQRAEQQVQPLAMMFRGFLVNISNPKAIVFMLAVLPQFITPSDPLVPQYGRQRYLPLVPAQIRRLHSRLNEGKGFDAAGYLRQFSPHQHRLTGGLHGRGDQGDPRRRRTAGNPDLCPQRHPCRLCRVGLNFQPERVDPP